MAFIASCLSTSPSTASLLVSFKEDSKSLPCFPVAAISAARLIVSLKDTPYAFAISFAVAATSFLILDKSAADVAATPPYTFVSLTNSASAALNESAAALPNAARGTVNPTVN